jgi:Flp pilus assembly protein TadD
VRLNFGTALFNAGKFQDAAASYREAVRLSPAFAHAHYTEAHRLDPSLNPPN